MELHYLSANEALEKFKNKTLSPVELIKAIINRAEKINPKINAHNFTFYDDAIKAAKKSEEKYSLNKNILPLEGIPMAIKDEEDIIGQPYEDIAVFLAGYNLEQLEPWYQSNKYKPNL